MPGAPDWSAFREGLLWAAASRSALQLPALQLCKLIINIIAFQLLELVFQRVTGCQLQAKTGIVRRARSPSPAAISQTLTVSALFLAEGQVTSERNERLCHWTGVFEPNDSTDMPFNWPKMQYTLSSAETRQLCAKFLTFYKHTYASNIGLTCMLLRQV